MEDLAFLVYKVLANNFVLYTKVQNLHWNITGPDFYQVHLLLGRVYETLYEDVDRLGEIIRSLDSKVPAGISSFLSAATVQDKFTDVDVGNLMIALVADINMCRDCTNMADEKASELKQIGVCNALGDIREKLDGLYYLVSSFTK